MDSGNSSSMQSSSGGGRGGEEEYDSRAVDQSISAFDHHNHHVPSLPPQQQSHLNVLHFDQNSDNSLIPPNYFNNNSMFLSVNQQPDPVSQPDLRTFSATSSFPPPNNIGVIKKTKKRSRASRRAPTTVLMTETSNFRAMVQEFTGIPSPPLFNNSVVNTTRLNTFLGLSSSSSPNSYNNLLLRPFAQQPLPTTSPLLSGSQIQQYQNPNNSFENINLQSLLQAQISNITSNPRSNDNVQFGQGMLQSPSTTPLTTTTAVANGNITTGENGGYGGSDHDHNNDSTWLCSSSDQRT
ncbi:VQ motif-containing protein [Hirschfeldia incana]|nr:VQ motif-containing protein [Hirschfeldia incana]